MFITCITYVLNWYGFFLSQICSIEDSESSMDDRRLEKCGEYDAAFPMTTGYCQLLTVAQYETQATTETEKALKVSIIYLQFWYV